MAGVLGAAARAAGDAAMGARARVASLPFDVAKLGTALAALAATAAVGETTRDGVVGVAVAAVAAAGGVTGAGAATGALAGGDVGESVVVGAGFLQAEARRRSPMTRHVWRSMRVSSASFAPPSQLLQVLDSPSGARKGSSLSPLHCSAASNGRVRALRTAQRHLAVRRASLVG